MFFFKIKCHVLVFFLRDILSFVKLNRHGHVGISLPITLLLVDQPTNPAHWNTPVSTNSYYSLRCVLKLENYESYHVHKNHQGVKFIDNDPSKQNTVIFESTVFWQKKLTQQLMRKAWTNCIRTTLLAYSFPWMLLWGLSLSFTVYQRRDGNIPI